MSYFTTKDGVNIYYKSWGKGQPVLFSHGWPLSADMWDDQMNFLAENGYQAIAFDRRGFGRSGQPWCGNDYDTFAADIKALIEHLQLAEKVVLVGFSMGGGDVTRYIGLYGTEKVRALALLGAVTPYMLKSSDNPNGVEKAVFDDIKMKLRADRANFLKEFFIPFYGADSGQAVSEGVMKQSFNIAVQASLKSTLDCVSAFSETDFREDIKKIDVPTLIIHGSGDNIVPITGSAEASAKLIPNAQLKVYSGAPHGFAVTHKEQLNSDLLAFLNTHAQ